MRVRAKLSQRAWGSSYEAQYDLLLKARLQAKEIQAYWYEPIGFRVGARASYTPDFLLLMDDGSLEAHEVKGWHKNIRAASLHIKAAARMNPWCRFVRVTKPDGGWHMEEIKP